MDVYEDVGTLYCEYIKNNEDNTMTELEFFKSAFKDAMDEMDTLHQQYHTLNEQFNKKKVESNFYAEDVVQLQTENKSLTEEIVTLKVQEKAYKEKYELLQQKLATIEVKYQANYNENKLEQQIVHNLSSSDNMDNYAKRTDLQPLESKISFIEKLVCSKMEKLNISNETNVIKCDNTLKINDNSTEWWCPKHSTFLEILNGIKIAEQSVEDQYLIRTAKARFIYWEDKKKNTPRCPTLKDKRTSY